MENQSTALPEPITPSYDRAVPVPEHPAIPEPAAEPEAPAPAQPSAQPQRKPKPQPKPPRHKRQLRKRSKPHKQHNDTWDSPEWKHDHVVFDLQQRVLTLQRFLESRSLWDEFTAKTLWW